MNIRPKLSYCLRHCAAVFVLYHLALPQASADDGPHFWYDIVIMRSDSASLSHLDVFMKIPNSSVQFIKDDDNFKASYEITLQLKGDKDGKSTNFGKEEDIFADNITETNSDAMFNLDKMVADIAPGKYEAELVLKDVETRKQRKEKFDLVVREFPVDSLAVSDLLFVKDFQRAESGKLAIVPRVSDEQYEHSRLQTYFEVYNIPAADSFDITFELLDSDGKVVHEGLVHEQSQDKERSRHIVSLLEQNILAHGFYSARVKVKYNDDSAVSESGFNWLIAGLPKEFANLDAAIDVLKYLASGPEFSDLKKSEDKHAEFLRFWKAHDPTPETPENELRDEYYSRVLYANEAYGAFKTDGWRTDRGWVLIMLGAPDNITRDPYNQNAYITAGRTVKAIEAWTYYRFNRQLVFLDENGFGEYRLYNRNDFFEIIH